MTAAPPAAPPLRLSDLMQGTREVNLRDLPLGNQTPTHRLVPPAAFSHGHEAIGLAEIVGINLDEFQRQGLIDDLGANMVITADGRRVERWAAKETCEVCSRRNGKTERLVVLILYGLFLGRERKIMYTAHRDDTAADVWAKVVAACKNYPELWNEIVPAGPRRSNGQRQIELKNGQVVYFRTRTNEGFRGQGFDRLIIDEAQDVTEEEMAAILPVVSGEENAQVNFAATAGNRHSVTLGSLWASFGKGERSLCYRGWHAEESDDHEDLHVLARVNPAFGRRLDWEWCGKELRRFGVVKFCRERLGIATYPRPEGEGWVIPEAAWIRARDEKSEPTGAARYVLEADPQLEAGSIGAAARRDDGAMHIGVTEHRAGIGWMIPAVADLVARDGGEVWVDPKGPAAILIEDLRTAGITPRLFTPENIKDACAWFYTSLNPQPLVEDQPETRPAPGVYHRGGELLTTALAAASTRPLLDRWAWKRANEVNQGPLMAVTLAAFAVVLSERSSAGTAPPSMPLRSSGFRERTYRDNPSATADLATANF